ncbi:MAG: type II toxin-antitoxin system YafQ family toxin [Magnetococcales bacterium]|nr:type II toxin-antitoxin system YafQ family toxin [Magnetococcales bacterium]
MNRRLKSTRQFKRDLKLMQKRGKDPEKLWDIVEMILASVPLDVRYKPHRLSGNYASFWECHIEPDWLLIWDDNEIRVMLVRTGTHSDLF